MQARPIIQDRMEKYSASGASEIRFNLLAVCRNQRQHGLQMISQHSLDSELIRAALLSHGVDETEDIMQDVDLDFTPVPMDLSGLGVSQLRDRLADCRSQIAELRHLVAREDEKAAHYRQENARRRHNFIPFIISLLKSLAERNLLQPLIDAAAQKAKTKSAAGKS